MEKEDTVALLRSLLISKKGAYEFKELLRDFKEEAGYPLPLFGYNTPLDFLKSVPDMLQLVQSYHQIMVKPVDNGKSTHIASLVRRQKPARNKHREVSRFNQEIHNTEKTNKKLANLKSQIKLWKPVNNIKKLDPSRCAAIGKNNNENKRTSSLHDTHNSSLVKRNVHNGYEVDHKKLNSCMNNSKYSYQDENILPSNGAKEMNVVDNIIKDLNEIPKLNLEHFAQKGEYVEICVPAVCNPHNFTIQLRRFKIKLLNLMFEIQMFYGKNGDDFKMSESLLEPGQLCVALTKTNSDNAQWYRAIVLKYVDDNNALVALIDYGTITEIDISNVRFMDRRFGKLSPQALSGYLANIKPISGTLWSEESTKRFMYLVFERNLIASIVDLDYEEMWLSVKLSFTKGTDRRINDTLVAENLAIFDSGVSNKGTCLPWTGNDGILSFSDPIPTFFFCPKDAGQPRNERSQKKKSSEGNTSREWVSYSESNARLLEMFTK